MTVFIETTVFTEDIQDLMPDELYRKLQQHLASRPDVGDLIVGSKGLRKIRWNLPGTGKRGGARVIYFWRVAESQILMLAAYRKADAENLTPAQVKMLASIVENWK